MVELVNLRKELMEIDEIKDTHANHLKLSIPEK